MNVGQGCHCKQYSKTWHIAGTWLIINNSNNDERDD